jgi:ABC-type branched-subunit amino acid transport system substrate-binding protein
MNLLHSIWLSLLCVALSPNGAIKIRIGLNVGFDLVNDLSLIDIPQAVFIRAAYFNQITNFISPDASVEIVFFNHSMSKQNTIQNSIQLVNRGVIASIGSTYSSLTELGSLITNTYQIPLCDGAATSPSLSNKNTFGNFFRTIPNDANQAEAILLFIKSQGWNKVSIAYTTESYGQGLATFFTNAARAHNVTILSSQPVYPGATSRMTDTVQNLRDSNARIFVYFGYGQEYFNLVESAKKFGIYGAGYNWLSGDGLSILPASLNKADVSGTTYFFPVEGDF